MEGGKGGKGWLLAKPKRRQLRKRKRYKEPQEAVNDDWKKGPQRQLGAWPDAEEEKAPIYERWHKVAKVTDVNGALAAFNRPLPACWRAANRSVQHFKGKSAFHRSVDYIDAEFQRIVEGWRDRWNPAPVPVKWFPGAWKLTAGALKLRDRESPDMAALADWLARGVANGHVVRQEEASIFQRNLSVLE